MRWRMREQTLEAKLARWRSKVRSTILAVVLVADESASSASATVRAVS